MKKYKKLFLYVGIIAGAILLPTWIYLGYIEHVYAGRPHQPRPETGWTTPFSEKNATVYVSAREKETVTWLIRMDMGLFFVMAGCLFFAAGPLRPRPPK